MATGPDGYFYFKTKSLLTKIGKQLFQQHKTIPGQLIKQEEGGGFSAVIKNDPPLKMLGLYETCEGKKLMNSEGRPMSQRCQKMSEASEHICKMKSLISRCVLGM